MKKSVIIVSLLFLVLSSVLVSASYYFPINDLRQTGQNLIQVGQDIVTPFLEFTLGVDSGVDKYFFQRILLLILVYAIIFLVLKRVEIFQRNKGAMIIVSLITAVLGARYMGSVDMIEAALLPYGTLTVAITVLLPFMIYFLFVYNTVNTTTGRRLAWIIFAAVFAFLWLTRITEVGEAGLMYGFGIALVLACLLFDSTIKKYFGLHEISKWGAGMTDKHIAGLQADYQKLMGVNSENARRARLALARQIRDAGGVVPGHGFSGGEGI